MMTVKRWLKSALVLSMAMVAGGCSTEATEASSDSEVNGATACALPPIDTGAPTRVCAVHAPAGAKVRRESKIPAPGEPDNDIMASFGWGGLPCATKLELVGFTRDGDIPGAVSCNLWGQV